ncbi:hypothetical protein DUNSADRAFT_4416 [Dunaliella salina]|uniref:AP2/ERF domain-containing protein n=1 Tax=Dunaliella salina TaxID=3046 RepID=A0ABQ7GS39_DUNSA|nr:hypothetical protein DUNSADRAFT_4416 [Dunaliella salina]|eukprot:KAF5837436.1 hypothetical protein DUNSADRAFT_4416 [Dunaliella salina]
MYTVKSKAAFTQDSQTSPCPAKFTRTALEAFRPCRRFGLFNNFGTPSPWRHAVLRVGRSMELTTLCEEYPGCFRMSMLPEALGNAAQLGVRDVQGAGTKTKHSDMQALLHGIAQLQSHTAAAAAGSSIQALPMQPHHVLFSTTAAGVEPPPVPATQPLLPPHAQISTSTGIKPTPPLPKAKHVGGRKLVEQQQGGPGMEDIADEEEEAREEERRQAKRARGIHPSSLPFTFYSYLGVFKEGGDSGTQYSARAALVNKDSKKAHILVGRFDHEDEAAQARDVAIMALGASPNPRLNFDADHYTLEAVKLMLMTLCEEYPSHFRMSMLPEALSNASLLGVRGDLDPSATNGSMEIVDQGGAKQRQPPCVDAVQLMGQPGGATLVRPIQEQQQQQQQQLQPSRETCTTSRCQSKLEPWASESSLVEHPAPWPPKPNAVALRISVLRAPQSQPSTQLAQAAPAKPAAAQSSTAQGFKAAAAPESAAQAVQPSVAATPAEASTSQQAEGQQHAPVQLVSVTLNPTFDSAYSWGNRRWQDTQRHEDPLDMLALLATEEVDYKAGCKGSGGGASRVGAGVLLSQPSTGPGKKRGREEGKEYKQSDAGDGDAVHSEGGDREDGGEGRKGSKKRARQGGVAGEAGGIANRPLLNGPRHVRVAQAEQLLQRLAREDFDVFSTAVKSTYPSVCMPAEYLMPNITSAVTMKRNIVEPDSCSQPMEL